MSKKPELEHEYHARKDKLKITIQGYALKSKSTREGMVKKMRDELEQSRARLVDGKKKSRKKTLTKKAKKPGEEGQSIETPGT